MTAKLHTIVVGKVTHPYWKPGAFVALGDNDWGPSPTLRIVDVPAVFLTAAEARRVIDEHSHEGIELEVATFVRQRQP